MTISTFILAIALVESGNNPKAVGRAGERSAYQITEKVWKANTSMPFTNAHTRNPQVSRYVAERHALYLRRMAGSKQSAGGVTVLYCVKLTEKELVLLCAAGWHRGEGYMKRPVSRWSKETRDYADRVWNVYQQLKREGK